MTPLGVPWLTRASLKKTKRISRAKLQQSGVVALNEDAQPYRFKINGGGNEKPLAVLDTFAGAGGFSLGFELAG